MNTKKLRLLKLLQKLKNKSPKSPSQSKLVQNSSPSLKSSPRLAVTDFAQIAVCERKLFLKFHGNPDERVPLPKIQRILQVQGIIYENKLVDPSSFTKVTYTNRADGKAKTIECMRQGVSGIYQGILYDDDLSGQPDLLIRTPGISKLGNFYYRPVDIKSGKKFKVEYELQMMAYLYLLKSIQEIETYAEVYLSDNTRKKVVLKPRFYELLEFAQRLANGVINPQPITGSYCNRCVWREHCFNLVKKDESIVLIPQLPKQAKKSLLQEGIVNLSTLAETEPSDLLHIKGIGPKTSVLTVNRAKSFVLNEAIPISKPNIPTSTIEVYLDLESIQVGSPRSEDTRYYMFGWCIRNRNNDPQYHYELAEKLDQERDIWEMFLTKIDNIPGPIFHYSNYEKTAIRNLIRRYGDDERASRLFVRFVDLYKEVKNNVALPLSSYSIKKVAPWLGYKWIGEVQNSADTMIEYLRWQRTRNRKHLENILTYNEHDCRAMIVIKDWLLELEV